MITPASHTMAQRPKEVSKEIAATFAIWPTGRQGSSLFHSRARQRYCKTLSSGFQGGARAGQIQSRHVIGSPTFRWFTCFGGIC